ncbi:MAG: NAD(P)H-dependent oxidoreductase [Verrucomicrobiota bacterium]
MKNVFIINAHEQYPFSEGRLNASLVAKAKTCLERNNYAVRITTMQEDLDIDREIANHQWADLVMLQTPVNWMGVPWSFKKYMDLVYTQGMDGRLCAGDGRTRSDASKQYGQGGTLEGKRYMLSLTFNAPVEAFDDTDQYLFEGKSVDDLFLPTHMNFRFFGMTRMDTFACYDVMKNPNIEGDFSRFEEHLKAQFAKL